MDNPLIHRPRHISDLLTIFIVCCIVYILPSSLRPLANPDEGRYSEIPREMVASGDWVTPRLNGLMYFYKPPLHYWLTAASIETFGVNRFSVRLPNSLITIFGIMLVYMGGRALYGRTAGIFSAAVLGSTLLYYALGSIIILDMAVSVFVSGALLSFIVAWKQKNNVPKRFMLWMCVFVFSGFAVMTKGLIGIIIPGMVAVIYLFIMNPLDSLKQITKWDVLAWVVGLAVFAAISVPWHVLAAIATPALETSEGLFSKNPEGQGFAWYYIINEHFLRYIDAKTSNRYQPFWFFWVIVPVGFIPWVVLLPKAVRESVRGGWRKLKEKNPEFIFFSIWILFTILFFSMSKSKLIPYILPVYPAFALMIGPLLAKVWEQPQRFKLRVESYILCGLGFLTVIGLVPLYIILSADGKMIDPAIAIWVFSATGVLLFAGTAITLVFAVKRRVRKCIVAMFVTMGVFLFMFNPFGRHVQRADTEDFAKIIKTEMDPSDRIIAAYCYGDAQDLPLWMENTISLYGPNRKHAYGVPKEQQFGFDREKPMHEDRYLTEEAFKKVLASEGVYIVVMDSKLDSVKDTAQSITPLRELDRKGRLILLTNKPEKDAAN